MSEAVFNKKKYSFFDTNTRNLSFLQTAADLKKLGVKNYKFFLRLYDKRLSGVDPFSPDLSQEMIIAIIDECVQNPWYFIRECVRIPDQGGTGIPFQLHRANLAMIYLCLLGIDNYLTIPRQKGKTQSVISIILWAFLFGTSASEFCFINKSSEDAVNNLKRLKAQRDLLPPYLKMTVYWDEDGKELKDKDNERSLHSKMSRNSIVTKPSANSVGDADRIGRGSTQTIQQYDEVEFTKHIKTIVEAAGPAYLKASQNARRNGVIHFRSFTSTPGDLDTNAGQEAKEILAETCKWSEKFYDWSRDDLIDYIDVNSGNKIVYIEYSYTQLGEGEDWFVDACQSVQNNPIKIKREILLKRIRGSSQSPFDQIDMDALDGMRGEIKEELWINKLFSLDIYAPLKREHIYFLGIDVSDGIGGDNSTIQVVDPYTFKTCAEFKSAFIGPVDFFKLIYTLVRKHIPRSIIIIERNRGGPIIEMLRATEIFHNVYFDDSADPTSEHAVDVLDAKGFLKQEAARRRYYGVNTTRGSRPKMFELLGGHVRDYKDRFIGNNLINEILSLIKTRTGKVEAGPGFHDDSVMAYLMVLYVWYHGNNLARYGFVKGSLPSEEEQNKGIEQWDEELEEQMARHFSNPVNRYSFMDQVDTGAQMREEYLQAQREYAALDTFRDNVTKVEDFNQDYNSGSIPLDFFDSLND